MLTGMWQHSLANCTPAAASSAHSIEPVRGDTCFAAYVGKRLSASPDDAAHFAAAVTTLKQEKPGSWRGTLNDVAAVPARIRRS
jgi:hypothetical protein